MDSKEAQDAYHRVMLDHTELITRVSRVEDRVRIDTCIIAVLAIMVALLAGYVWVAVH